MATINLIFHVFCNHFHLMSFLIVVHEFYCIHLFISYPKNTEPMYLTTSVAHMPLPDTNFEHYL